MPSDQAGGLGPDGTGTRPKSERSVAALLADLANEMGLLFRQEVALFKAELNQKFGQFGRGLVVIAIAGLIAFSGWLVLLAAAVLGLANAVEPWLAALIVGVVVLAIGAGLFYFGKSRLDTDALIPRRTLNSLRKDEAWVKEQVL
jgi:fatty acid desaturase